MKKIILFTSLSLLLTACSSEEVTQKTTASKSEQTTQTSLKSVQTGSTQQTEQTSLNSTQNENNQQTVSTVKSSQVTSSTTPTSKVNTIKTTVTSTSEAKPVEVTIDELLIKTGKQHTIAGSEYKTNVVTSLTDVVGEYNANKSSKLTNEEMLEEIDKKFIVEKVDSSFNEADIRKIFAKDPERVVIYFEGDGRLFLAMK